MKKVFLVMMLAVLLISAVLSLSSCSSLLDSLEEYVNGLTTEETGTVAPTTASPTAAPTDDGKIPFIHTPAIYRYTLPEENFSDPIESEASAVIDDAIERAIACTRVMKDDRHAHADQPFEEDPNGYLAKLSAPQRACYDRFIAAGKNGESLTLTAEEYDGDLKALYFALYEPMTYCEPGLASYYDLNCKTVFLVTDSEPHMTHAFNRYYDPDHDQNVTVAKGGVTMQKVLHDAALLERVIARVVRFMPDGLSTYDKYYYLAAVLSERVAYDARPDNCFTAYGALVGGRAVCEGYTSAYYLLCRAAGLWCAYRNGQPQGQGHTWNMIKLDSGVYNVDVTWCDGYGVPYEEAWYACFVRSDEAFARDGHNATTGVAGTGAFEPNPYQP
ncbi:MAG: hypothetical protein KIG36_03625 [Eubacteriales bacterium]|nr:hypothetical protein [Eubacteriales bacterium]